MGRVWELPTTTPLEGDKHTHTHGLTSSLDQRGPGGSQRAAECRCLQRPSPPRSPSSAPPACAAPSAGWHQVQRVYSPASDLRTLTEQLKKRKCTTFLQRSAPLQHVLPGLPRHEFAARQGQHSNPQPLLTTKSALVPLKSDPSNTQQPSSLHAQRRRVTWGSSFIK